VPYRKVTYPCLCEVWRWPNDPRGHGPGPDFVAKVRWMWYAKWDLAGGEGPDIGDSPIVIIAFSLVTALLDFQFAPSGFGDYLVPQMPIPRIWQLLHAAPHALGYPNQTMLGKVTGFPLYPAGPPP
jgi:hypothetical protein